jgi:TatD DNase family protein
MPVELVDSHCHLDLIKPREGGLDGVVRAARADGVGHMLCVCVTLEKLPQVLDVAERFEGVFASVGVHPNERDRQDPTVERLIDLAGHPRVVAIGETGLDYFRSEGDLEWQRDRFRRHIAAAKACGLPLIIHSRSAPDDTLRVLREEGADAAGGVMHCFAEDWPTAEAALDLGFYISFSGIVTFASATTLQDVARRVPLDRLLVETDAPWLAPVPHRGKPNEPAYVRHVAESVARLRAETLETVAEATTENFFRLFPKARRRQADAASLGPVA